MKKKLLVATAALLAGGVCGAPALAAENPVDQAGIQHNMYLGCLKDLGASPDNALSSLVEKCGYDPGMPLQQFIETQQPLVDSVDPTRSVAENIAAQRERFSAYEFSFIERIDRIVENAEDMDEAAAQFAELEKEAIERLDPKSKNGALILGGLSVARHSTRYWSEYAAKHGALGGSGSTSKGRFWKWLGVIAADVVGYFISDNNVGTAATTSSNVHTLLFEGF
ncbi:hypothetical protein [Luteimonas aquatica]|uniref:hypothetical protein n=1 Tax=Luteimonas aquatica TaxID=450364 RepID=UPI001F5604B3|nr:hypothetical protein [Luteimonas aquatica]